MEQSDLEPDRRHATQPGECCEQQLSGHYGNESPRRNGQQLAGHRRPQGDETGDEQCLYGNAYVPALSVVPVAFRHPVGDENRHRHRSRQQPVQGFIPTFAPVDPNDGCHDRCRHQQVDDAVRLAADIPDDHREEPHEHQRHDDQEEDGRDEEHLVDLGLLKVAAVHELSAFLELPVDQATEDEDADVKVESLEEGES